MTTMTTDIAILVVGLAAFFYAVENEWYKLAGKWLFLTTLLMLSFAFWEAAATDYLLIYFIFVMAMYIVLLFIDALMLLPRAGAIIAKMVRR